MIQNKHVPLALFVGATPMAATEVVRSGMSSHILGLLAMLVSITAITFIIVLLACGLRTTDL